MRTALRHLGIPVVVVSALFAVSACSSGDEPTLASDPVTIPTTAAPTVPTTSAANTTNRPAPTTPVDTSDIPLPPAPPDTSDIPVPPAPPDTSDLPILLAVTVGVDSGADRVENVPLGSSVTITIVNPDEDDEFHLHGYELGDGQSVPAGQPAVFTFTASIAGDFELESHESGELLLTLRVA
jgi:hypothetical protein